MAGHDFKASLTYLECAKLFAMPACSVTVYIAARLNSILNIYAMCSSEQYQAMQGQHLHEKEHHLPWNVATDTIHIHVALASDPAASACNLEAALLTCHAATFVLLTRACACHRRFTKDATDVIGFQQDMTLCLTKLNGISTLASPSSCCH